MTSGLLKKSKFFALVFCLLFGISQAFAQSTVTGAISGKISDPQGAVIPNASVTVTNVNTNQETTATADADGGFRVANLQPGTYSVKITATGFADYVQERVVVEVGQITTINAPLVLPGATAVVQVTTEAPVINTTSQDFATNVNQTSINELPINGRRASNFVLLTPATVPDGTFGLISFRGVSGLLNNSTVDGGDNNQSFQSEERGRTRIAYVVSQSAIREFQVNTSNYSAEYGRSAGGVVNTVTKSGTNGFHGMLFEYYRNNKFGARNPGAFAPALVNGVTVQQALKPVDVRHQFGGAIGGPIIKNKLFFFFSYDQQKRNFPALSRFVNLAYLSTLNRASLTSRGLTDKQIDDSVAFITSLTGQVSRRADQTLLLPKIDWQINDNNLFSATYNRLRAKSPNGLQTQATNTVARGSYGDDYVNVDTLNLRLQSTISSNLLNEARYQYARDFEYAFSSQPIQGEPLTATTSQGTRSPFVRLTGGLDFGTSANFERNRYPFETRNQFADTITYTRGRHTLKFGGDFNHVTDDIQNLRSEAGSYTYPTINDFILDYANYVATTKLASTTQCVSTTTRFVGRCYSGNYVQGVGIPGIKFSTNEYSFFIQDDFRITPRLTVNLGLRYEYQKLPDAILANTSTTVIPNDGRTLAEATSTLPDDKNNFGPRFGFAYDLTGDGKTSIRGGAGIYYGRFLGGHIWYNLLNTGNPNGSGQISIAASTTSPVFPTVLPNSNQTLASAAISFYQKNYQAPEIAQYDLVIERQIARNTSVSISYLGSRGYHLPTYVDQNLALTNNVTTFTVYGGQFDGRTFELRQFAKANSALPSLIQFQSSVKSEYNALVLQANRRFTGGLQVQASYTLAKSTDTGQNSSITSFFNSPLDVFDRRYETGPSNFDVRHKFVASAVYAFGYKGDNKSVYSYILGGWTLSPIFQFYSGQPYSGSLGTSINGTSGSFNFPLAQRNAYRLPNLWNLDLRLSKRFNFTERFNLELLAEGFNVTNRTQVVGVNTSQYTRSTNCFTINGTTTNNANGLCSNPTFGATSSTDSNLFRERQIQFAARFHF